MNRVRVTFDCFTITCPAQFVPTWFSFDWKLLLFHPKPFTKRIVTVIDLDLIRQSNQFEFHRFKQQIIKSCCKSFWWQKRILLCSFFHFLFCNRNGDCNNHISFSSKSLLLSQFNSLPYPQFEAA